MNSRISAALLLIVLMSLPFVADAADPPTGRVTGRIDCQATDCNGVAALWSAADNIVPAVDRYVLTPAVVTALETDGSFELVAPVGDYYVGAQLRKTSGPLFGAPRVGDHLYLMKPQDEIGYRIAVTSEQVTDIGRHSASWTYAGITKSPQMGISGQVVDADQRPVSGLLVFAFADAAATKTPLAVSSRSGVDGSFILPLATPGAVYLRARKNYRGGQPEAGDYTGMTTGQGMQPVVVEAGKLLTAVKVYVRKLPSVLQRKNAPNTARPDLQKQ